jgi:telomerase protein component 1
MPLWTTARVFLSSTFRDVHAERDHLINVVFPRLRERLEPYRVELVDVDLRWGVTREQAESDQALGLCLQQVDECRPFFLGFLGHRYGWVPQGVPADAARRFPWVADHPGASITELEARHGALNDPAGHALFCLRDRAALESIPEPSRSAFFVDKPERLEALAGLIRRSGRPVRDYTCRWDGQAYDRPSRTQGRLVGLGDFGDIVEGWLWARWTASTGWRGAPTSGWTRSTRRPTSTSASRSCGCASSSAGSRITAAWPTSPEATTSATAW